jgi:hypothetical protein
MLFIISREFMYMKKVLAMVAVLSFLFPAAAFANSTVDASAGVGATISPSGVTVVPTGITQTFTVGVDQSYQLTGVTLDGVSQSLSNVNFTGIAGDLTTHTISVSAAPTGGAEPYCSSPTAPGWQVGLIGGGCGGTQIFVPRGETLNGFYCSDMFTAGCILPQ